jgi:hypothetical protein
MKKFLITALIALSGIMAQAQTQQTRNTADFNKIDVQNGIEVILTQGESSKVRVESAMSNNIVTEVSGKTLKIYVRGEVSTMGDEAIPAKVYVTQKDINGLRAQSGAAITAVGQINTGGLAIDLSAGASFKGMIKCEGALQLNIRSGANFDGIVLTDFFEGNFKGGAVAKISGQANNAVIHSNTGATCLAANFIAQKATIDAKRTSSIVINVQKSIHATADTTASVSYYGSPERTMLGEDSYAFKRN